MKPSKTMVETISNIPSITSLAQMRCVGSNFLLALARKEISAVDVLAAAKIMDSISNTITVQLKVDRAANEFRSQAGAISKPYELGNLAIEPIDQE